MSLNNGKVESDVQGERVRVKVRVDAAYLIRSRGIVLPRYDVCRRSVVQGATRLGTRLCV
jgi:hypothetical protein